MRASPLGGARRCMTRARRESKTLSADVFSARIDGLVTPTHGDFCYGHPNATHRLCRVVVQDEEWNAKTAKYNP